MNSKKKVFIVAICLFMIVFSFLGGSTYAKYLSKVNINGKGEVAQWSFKVNDNSEINQTVTLVSGKDDAGVIRNKIAPGTYGNFNILIDATGAEVGIDYAVTFNNELNKPTNLKYVYEGVEYSNLFEIAPLLSGNIPANDPDKLRTINIGWKWDFETGTEQDVVDNNDIADTNDSIRITDFSFDINVVGTQSLNA